MPNMETVLQGLSATRGRRDSPGRSKRNLTLDSVDVLAGQLDLAVSLTLGAR